MTGKQTPKTKVQEQFGGKEKLIQALLKLPSGLLLLEEGEEKKDFQERMQKISNQKLLRLYERGQTLVARKLDNKTKLVDALLKLEGRSKDKSYREKVLTRSVGWLWDRVQVYEKSERSLQAAQA